MHEQSLMRGLLRQVRKIASDEGCNQVAKINLEVGVMSGVEPPLLASAFSQLATETMFQQAELNIVQVELEAECTACNHHFPVKDFRFNCPMCENNVRIVRGDQCELVNISVYNEEPA